MRSECTFKFYFSNAPYLLLLVFLIPILNLFLQIKNSFYSVWELFFLVTSSHQPLLTSLCHQSSVSLVTFSLSHFLLSHFLPFQPDRHSTKFFEILLGQYKTLFRDTWTDQTSKRTDRHPRRVRESLTS